VRCPQWFRWCAAASCLVPPAAATLTLSLNRDTVPARIAVHWSATGEVNGWSTPTGASATFLVLQTLFVCAAIGSAFASDQRKARIGSGVTTLFAAVIAASWVIVFADSTSRGIAVTTVWGLLFAAALWAAVPFGFLSIRIGSEPNDAAPK
jgi:ABC-type uncharacterized transport system permease subunit